MSVSWWDWGRSGPQRRWQFPSNRPKRVSAQATIMGLTIGAGRSYHDGQAYVHVTLGNRSLRVPRFKA